MAMGPGQAVAVEPAALVQVGGDPGQGRAGQQRLERAPDVLGLGRDDDQAVGGVAVAAAPRRRLALLDALEHLARLALAHLLDFERVELAEDAGEHPAGGRGEVELRALDAEHGDPVLTEQLDSGCALGPVTPESTEGVDEDDVDLSAADGGQELGIVGPRAAVGGGQVVVAEAAADGDAVPGGQGVRVLVLTLDAELFAGLVLADPRVGCRVAE